MKKLLQNRFIARLVMLAVILLIGGIAYLFSARSGADSAYKDFREGFENSAQVHTIESGDSGFETYYVTKDNKRAYEYNYTTYSAKLNCSDDKFYIEDGQDMTDDVVDIDAYCSDEETSSNEKYNSTFKEFFSGEYKAEYTEEDDYYVVNGTYEQGGDYSIQLYKSGKKVVWKDSNKTYTIELKDDIELPKK